MSLIVCRLILDKCYNNVKSYLSDIMKDIKKQLGDKIRAIRQKRAMSQEDLAFEADLHRTYISDVERGSRNISIENIEKIAKALKVKPKNLLDFDE